MEKGQADTKKKDQKKDWAEMEDEAEQDEEIGAKQEAAKEAEKPKKVKAAGPKPQKNAQGDFIVAKFDVDTTLNVGKKKDADSGDEKEDDKISISDDLESDSGNDDAEEEKGDAAGQPERK
jgi:hypothetical protein